MISNKRSKVGMVGLVNAIVGWACGLLAVGAFFLVLRSSDSLLKTYVSSYLGSFTILPLIAFVVGNVAATVLGSIGYAATGSEKPATRAIVYSKSAMIIGSAGLLAAATFLVMILGRGL